MIAAAHLAQTCLESAIRVLEQMFFEVPIGAVDRQNGVTVGMVRREVPFSGSASGELRLAADPEVAEWLAAGFLGLDEDAKPEGGPAMEELANMVCGSLVSRVDPDGDFRLGVPREFSELGGEYLSVPLERGRLLIRTSVNTGCLGEEGEYRESENPGPGC